MLNIFLVVVAAAGLFIACAEAEEMMTQAIVTLGGGGVSVFALLFLAHRAA